MLGVWDPRKVTAKPKKDFNHIKMNRAAVRARATTAKAATAFRRTEYADLEMR